MDSITEDSVKTNSSKVTVIRGGLGYIVRGQTDKWYGVVLPKRSRGDIKGFSRASARRLRETLALASYKGGEAVTWGFCLTIPGRIISSDEVRGLWHYWQVIVRREFPLIPMVWRIELQKRKQAHWHCVVWIPGKGIQDTAAQAMSLAARWRRLVSSRIGPFDEDTDRAFELYGVDYKCLEGASATGIIGYLADHTSKHKQEQLGWKGRQWGVINKESLDFVGEVVAEVDQIDHKHAARQFRRLQEHLRRERVYTGGGVTPSGNVQRAIFGRDAVRLLDCYSAQLIDGAVGSVGEPCRPFAD